VEAAWKVVMPVLESWKKESSPRFPNYTPGSWGPKAAEALIKKDGCDWTLLPENGIIKKTLKKIK
jgi:glucose-6-phosphate 1-dehydrogenase